MIHFFKWGSFIEEVHDEHKYRTGLIDLVVDEFCVPIGTVVYKLFIYMLL